MPSRRVPFLDRPSGISPPLDPLWPHPHSAVRGLHGDHSLVFILLIFLFFETEGRGSHLCKTWTRWPHSCCHICNSTSRQCSFVYSATIPCSAVPESASALPLVSLYISLSLRPGLTLCTDQQQQPAACSWCHLDPAPHRTTSTSPDSSRTTDNRLVKHTWCCP